jgi:Ca2+-binding RTX toxin-like protein
VTTSGGSDIDFYGSGFTYGAGPPPTGGTVTSLTLDVGSNEATGLEDIQIYGLSLSLPAFQTSVGSSAAQGSNFWRTALSGNDMILLPAGASTLNFTFAGDGSLLLAGTGVSIGGDDSFLAGSGLLSGATVLHGDFTTIESTATGVGGDDSFNYAGFLVTGDFSAIFTIATGVGGDDSIAPLALRDHTQSGTFIAGDVDTVLGTLIGGDDLIDLRQTDVGDFSENLVLSGDAINVSLLAVVSGGDDTIHGSSRGEAIYGETFSGIFSSNFISGGHDLLFGHDGNDTISGDTGNDTVVGGDGNDSLIGLSGRDTADYSDKAGGVSVNLFSGTAITGGALNSGGFYAGGAVEDTLSTIESVIGSAFGDRLVGSNAASGRLSGGNGNDNISGLNGADTLFGDAGNDTLDGGASGDTLNGGAGTDTLNGNTGLDTADYSDRDGGVNINLINGTGITGGAMSGANYVGGALEDTIIAVENVIGSAFGDRLVGVSAGSVIDGRGGNDRISGFSGLDNFKGGAGDDTLEGGGNSDTLNGGLGADILDGSTGLDTVDYSDRTAGVSVDLIFGITVTGGALIAGVYQGGVGEDGLSNIENIIGTNFADHLIARPGNAVIDGRSGGDRIEGNTGNDSLTGAAGADTIIGGGGGDTIKGGADFDSLTGGTGDDQFFFEFRGVNEQDVIADFTAGGGVDEIHLSGFGPAFDTFGEVIANSFQNGADAVLDLGGSLFITLQNVSLANLTASDFVFS